MAVKIGDTFRHHYADGNPLWTVTAKAGRGMWRCAITDDMDWTGVERGFTTDDIERAKAWEQTFATMRDEHEIYFSTLPIGSIVHYDNGFAQYVRCVRVEGPKGKRLRPIALVGNWSDFDLPKLRADGTVSLGYHAKMIRDGEAFEPNYSNIWETKDAKGREWSQRGVGNYSGLSEIGRERKSHDRHQQPFDPATAEPIDLTPPAPSAEEQLLASVIGKWRTVVRVLEVPDDATVEDYRRAMTLAMSAAERGVRESIALVDAAKG